MQERRVKRVTCKYRGIDTIAQGLKTVYLLQTEKLPAAGSDGDTYTQAYTPCLLLTRYKKHTCGPSFASWNRRYSSAIAVRVSL